MHVPGKLLVGVNEMVNMKDLVPVQQTFAKRVLKTYLQRGAEEREGMGLKLAQNVYVPPDALLAHLRVLHFARVLVMAKLFVGQCKCSVAVIVTNQHIHRIHLGIQLICVGMNASRLLLLFFLVPYM